MKHSTLPIVVSDLTTQSLDTPPAPPVKPNPIERMGAKRGVYKKPKTEALDSKTEPLEKKVESLRYRSAILAARLAEEIKATLDGPLPKKDKARLVREIAWSYGVLFDKAAGGEASASLLIKFPEQVMSALKVGIALQIAPKHTVDTLPVVVSSS